MGRTKRRHRAWKQQMRARAKRKPEWYRQYGDISPGRLVAWAEPETPKNFYPTGMEKESNGGRPAQ